VGDTPRVFFVTGHQDTAELYGFALEHAGFAVRWLKSPAHAVEACRADPPAAAVVHFAPVRRSGRCQPGPASRPAAAAALIGLFSMALPAATLKQVLGNLNDVLMIPCSPDRLVSRLSFIIEHQSHTS
jgi:DNA-binding response OmpR family regulator